MSADNALTMFWNDDSVELSDRRLKKDIPPMPTVSNDFQSVRGGGFETLAYLALQVTKTADKVVITRAISSACSWLLNDNSNFTGGKNPTVELTGLGAAAVDNPGRATVLETNFVDAEPVTIGELLDLMEADADELGAYFGVLFLAGNKRINARNRTAFNARRKDAATASIIGEPVIFVADSIYLADKVLSNVYAAFLSCAPLRAQMTAKVVTHLDDSLMGPSTAFMSMFLLLVDSGMGALRMIKEAVIKHPWVRTEFPELRPELSAANSAQQILKRVPGQERSFLKAIHGNNFVPVNYTAIDNLTGVCRDILKLTTPSYANYDGGKVTDEQAAKIARLLSVESRLRDPVQAE